MLKQWPAVFLWLLSSGALLLNVSAVSAQDYPNKPLRILTGPPGGGGDFASRLIAQGLSGGLGQQVIVDNRPGIIPIEIVAKAPADGYTLVIDGASLWVEPLLRKLSYDPVGDFAPITFAVGAPNILVVHPSMAANSVKELIALAKAKPGEINYSSGSSGSTAHLAAELLKSLAGVAITQINYKGTGAAINAVVGGEVQLAFATPAVVTPHIKSNRLRALAVTSSQPSALASGLPTLASSVPGYEAISVYGVFAPIKTPATIINRLNREIVRFVNMPETKAPLLNAGLEPIGTLPDESAKKIKAEMSKWGKLIKDAGIRVD